jgi:hypothetical protein
VNIMRLRLFKDFTDITPMKEGEETAIAVANREIEALSDEIQRLQERKNIIEVTHNIEQNVSSKSENAQIGTEQDQIEMNTMLVGCGVCYMMITYC